ncbi:MAG: beta-1,6-N-acetylglucosaminyltransferase [Brevinema sp.]
MDTKIAWLLSGYKDPSLITNIINSIYCQGDSVFIHYDKNSPKEEFLELQKQLSHLPNVFCYQRYRTYWGSFLSVWAEVFMIKQLFKKKIDFDYMINLAGTTIPVKSQVSLREFLAQSSQKSFLGSYLEEVTFKSSDTISDETSNHLDGITHRTHFLHDNYIYNPRNLRYSKQLFFNFLKVLVKGVRIIKKLIPKGRLRLLSFPRIYYGAVQAMISRKHLEIFYKDPRFFWFTLETVSLQLPDEIFYHTAIRNLISLDEIILDCRLWVRWPGPATITNEMIPKIMQSNCFFARKCETEEMFNSIKKYIS